MISKERFFSDKIMNIIPPLTIVFFQIYLVILNLVSNIFDMCKKENKEKRDPNQCGLKFNNQRQNDSTSLKKVRIYNI